MIVRRSHPSLVRACLLGTVVLAPLLAPAQSLAQPAPSAGPAAPQHASGEWRAITRADVEAAYRMLRDDHPGAVAELGDSSFLRALEDGRALALRRADMVTSMQGYGATLAGFATGMGDAHVWSRTLHPPETSQWAGLVVAKRPQGWTVVDEETSGAEPSLLGARLTACDGRSVEALAAERLGGFHARWRIEAQQVQSAPRLLVDDGNPFVTRPSACRFQKSGRTVERTLAWRPIERAALRARLAKAGVRAKAGYGVRPFASGYWIALEGLTDKAPAVVEAVRRSADALRRAPVVVLDLRGNAGGSSDYGRQIADVLLGADRTRAVLGSPTEIAGCKTVWRASKRNAAQLAYYRDELALKVGPEFLAEITKQAALADAALAADQAFTGPTTCAEAEASDPVPSPPPSLLEGRLVIVTDYSCFSSCLLVTDQFRKLGALHLGQPTDSNTRYFEVREDKLPSGLSMFSTLQALSPGSPRDIGPFEPHELLEGDIADSAALEAWVGQRAGASLRAELGELLLHR